MERPGERVRAHGERTQENADERERTEPTRRWSDQQEETESSRPHSEPLENTTAQRGSPPSSPSVDSAASTSASTGWQP